MTVTRLWRKLKSSDFAEIDREKTVVILPLAAIEQHGPHLPLDVDLRINEGILSALVKQVSDELPFLILPIQEPHLHQRLQIRLYSYQKHGMPK